MTASTRIPIRVARDYEASPERVFDAWLDEHTVGRWLFATPEGRCELVEIEPHAGGRYRIVERRGEESAGHAGYYLAVERPGRLSFTFGTGDASVEPSRESDLVTVEIGPRAIGGTMVALVHETGAEEAEHADRARAGWASILDGLAHLLGER